MFGCLPNDAFFPVFAFMLIGAAITIIVVQPYKDTFKLYNKVDAIMILILSVHCLSIIYINESQVNPRRSSSAKPGIAVMGITSLAPLTYISIVVFHKLLPYQCIVQAFKQLKGLNLKTFRKNESVHIEPLEVNDSTGVD